MTESLLPSPTAPTFYFIGVTTAQSSSRRLFPLWMEVLGRSEVQWRGVDLPLGAAPALYREVVTQIKREPDALGGLVTTHKIDLLEAARDLFDRLGPHARATGEVSSIAKDRVGEEERLVGRATDPVAGGLSLDALLGRDYFTRSGGHVLLLGAGGAGTALARHLLQKQRPGDRPKRLLIAERSVPRLDRARHLLAPLQADGVCFRVTRSAEENDALLGELPPASVVINATGMGKDRPGSPLSSAAVFPTGGVIWDLNYRGELDFLQQARAQRVQRALTVADGWTYFLHGWAQVIGHVLHVQFDAPLFDRFAEVAAAHR